MSYAVAVVHGRFQPFHLGHLEYVTRAYHVSERLIVGVTNSDPSHRRVEPSAPHRHLLQSNPFPFWLRSEMVLGSLADTGCDLSRVRVVPFPIDQPNLLDFYVPRTAVHLLCRCDAWQEVKLRTLRAHGLEAVFCDNMKTTHSGTQIREMLRKGESVSHLVPPFVDRLLRDPAYAALLRA